MNHRFDRIEGSRRRPVGTWTTLVGVALSVSCSSAPATRELESVAKDWCLTIRASQVLPVYPLSEDVQPGDVFVVQTPLSEQTRIFEERGFLPLDQLVTRLRGLPYAEFYQDANWRGAFGDDAVSAAGTTGPATASNREAALDRLPRAAFPSYNFDVNRSGGLQLALPIQGVPVGLGLLGADKAQGSVTLRDAYTYGVDSASLIEKIRIWWASDDLIRQTLGDVARQTREPVYLRVVTRVFLTGGVTVTLSNLEASSAGLDVGMAPELELLDLAAKEPTKAASAIQAFQQASEALQKKLNDVTQGGAGGSLRLTQASRRAIGLDETFPVPLVIGYRGFDVKVFEDGSLSAPIPSFASITAESAALEGLQEGLPIHGPHAPEPKANGGGKHGTEGALRERIGDAQETADQNALREWLAADGKNQYQLVSWLKKQGLQSESVDAFLTSPDRADLRRRAVSDLVHE